MLLHRVADRTQWDTLALRLERLRRELRLALIRLRVYRSMVVAPKVDHATRSIRWHLEAKMEAVVFASMILLAVVVGILIARF